jgi:hypothetical protein
MVSGPIPSSTKISSSLVSWTTILGIPASATSKGERRAVPQRATYLDAEYDGVDDAVLPATTYSKASLGSEGQSPYEGEQTHVAGSSVHA